MILAELIMFKVKIIAKVINASNLCSNNAVAFIIATRATGLAETIMVTLNKHYNLDSLDVFVILKYYEEINLYSNTIT